jgi:F-type H+-transporting ATPase subunit alpha
MRKLSGTMKLDLAQYRELEAFAKFGSDLDPTTQRQLNRGARTVELLKQDLHKPLDVDKQIILLHISNEGILDLVPIDKIGQFTDEFIESVALKYETELNELRLSGELSKDLGEKISVDARNLTSQFNTGK